MEDGSSGQWAPRSRSEEKHSSKSRVSPYTSFVVQPLPACFTTEKYTVKASFFEKKNVYIYMYVSGKFFSQNLVSVTKQPTSML